jgi:hypothetical protein
MRKSKFKFPKPNISPLQESMTEMVGGVAEFWDNFKSGKILKQVGIKFFLGYLLFLYVFPQVENWVTHAFQNSMLTGIVKLLGVVSICMIPINYFLPTAYLYKKSIDSEYSYAEQFFCFISQSLVHFFIMEISSPSPSLDGGVATGHVTIFLTAIFWSAWCHYRLQGARRKIWTMDDKNIYQATWCICGVEMLLVARNIFAYVFTINAWFDYILYAIMILSYVGGLYLIKKRLVYHHIKPFIIIIGINLVLQFMIAQSSSIANVFLYLNGNSLSKLLPSGMIVLVSVNSLLRDLQLRSASGSGSTSTSKEDLASSLTMVGLIVGSLVFYYSQQNAWYMLLQYCIVLWNLSDVMNLATESKSTTANLVRRWIQQHNT